MSLKSPQGFKSELPVKLNRELGAGLVKEWGKRQAFTTGCLNFYYADRAL